MTGVQMAPLAEVRLLGHQHLVVVRSVRVVAVEAALAHRRVLPQERAAFLGVALQALLVDVLGVDHLRVDGVVGIVAARAAHLPFPHRVVGRPQALAADVLVAGEAGVGLLRRLQLGARGMEVVHAVARHAAHPAPLVDAAREMRLAALVVAVLALRVGRLGVRAREGGRRAGRPLRLRGHVRGGVFVTVRAVPGHRRVPGVLHALPLTLVTGHALGGIHRFRGRRRRRFRVLPGRPRRGQQQERRSGNGHGHDCATHHETSLSMTTRLRPVRLACVLISIRGPRGRPAWARPGPPRCGRRRSPA